MRGNNFGNYIGEQIFFEIISELKKKYKDKNIRNIFLFGYSSSASAVISLYGKYPYLFSGGLAVAGKANKWLLKNISNNGNLIILCVKFDIDANNIYYFNEENLDKDQKGVKNYLLDGFDHNTISTFMKNKYIINKVLNFKKNHNFFLKYYGISEQYQICNDIRILERHKLNEVYYCENYRQSDKIFINTINIRVIEIIPNSIINKYKIIKNNFDIIRKTQFILTDISCEQIKNYETCSINNEWGC